LAATEWFQSFFQSQCALCRFSIRAGLVFPRFAASKAEMVAAGVIPIDRLTDVRAPIEVAAARCGKQQLEAVYGIQMPTWPEDGTAAAAAANATSSSAKPSAAAAEVDSSASSQPAEEPAAEAAEPAPAAASYASSSSRVQQQQLSAGALLLLGLAGARGWATASGLADEARAGRQILKDYTNGKLLYCKLPPGFGRVGFAPDVAPLPGTVNAMQLGIQQQQPQQQQQQQRQAGVTSSSSSSTAAAAAPSAADDDKDDDKDDGSSGSDGGADDDAFAAAAAGGAESGDPSMLLLSEADLELMEGLGVSSKAKSSKRADHKFHKKAARSKGSRGIAVDAGGYDGAALSTGKKGGLVRVGGY
jgi:large subunit GTPase 1